jgi:hypothetical protein
MLSRVADSLYWMGRYIERADHVARQLDVHLTIVPEQAVEAARRRRNRLIACLVRPDYPAAAIQSDQDLAYLLTFDEDNPNSIVRCIASGRENARQVREQINSQMWEQINQLYLQMQMSSMTQIWVGQPHSFYHGINQDVYRLQGITDSRITRDQGWHFVQLGRYLERASEVADMLDVDFRELYASPRQVTDVTDDAVDPDRAAHRGDQLTADRQSQAGATEATVDRAVRLREGFEYQFQLVGSDTDTRIAHLQLQMRTPSVRIEQTTGNECDLTVFSKFDRVTEQIDDDLRQARWIATQPQCRINVQVDLQAVAAGQRLQFKWLGRRFQGDKYGERYRFDRQPAGFDAREIEQIVDHH